MTRFRYVLLISGVLLVAAAIAGVAQPHVGGAATPATTTITVTGNGTVDATPDQASFDFGVQVNAATASEALANDAQQANAIIAALKNAGIDSSKIQTTQVSLWPQTSNDGTQITGYQASNSVDVTAPIEKSGDLVDAAVGAGANNVDGPNLAVADQSSYYAEALKKAVTDAQTKAQAIAAAAGLTLGGIVHISDQGAQPTPIMYGALDATAAKPATPIEAGSQQIQATVTVSYSAS
ncbi:MAG TPA: SIMPL domain-containing protein [Gaiellaceae bacterium]|nr:SIMPL domain-containing protein [Gaiellaceae bacterium]